MSRSSTIIPLEREEQEAFFDYVRMRALSDDRYRNIYANEFGLRMFGNAQQRTRMANALKRRGSTVGIPDVCVAIPRHSLVKCDCGRTSVQVDRAGLYIEFKRRGNGPTIAQANIHKRLLAAGYLVVVCFSAEEAIEVLERYLSGLELTMELINE